MSVERLPFGNMPDGKEVYKYVITNNNDYSVHILTLGATLNSFFVKDSDGALRDVLLGFDSVQDYLEKSDYQGATVGPCCNRIGGAALDINGRHYSLTANEKDVTCLHSGGEFSFVLWNAMVVDADAVELSYLSPDGTNGFPGEKKVKAVFRLDDDNALHIEYDAAADRDTYLNLTNHAYFNLDGYDSGDILSQTLSLNAGSFVPVDALSIPTGEIKAVENTPFDFRAAKKIGTDIEADCEQLRLTGGFDHNFCIDGWDGTLRECACAEAVSGGVKMNVYTTLPGVQFYAGNFLNGTAGKGGKPMNKRSGFCLETQYFPDTPHNAAFPSCLFKAGEHYTSETVYSFSVQK